MNATNRLVVLIVLAVAAPCSADTDAAPAPRFLPLQIVLDSPRALAAWQFELQDSNGAMQVAGIERGGHPAFPRAPYYDRDAVAGGNASRIVVADFSLAEASRLPTGRIRLATLHLMLEGEPAFELRLITATTADGEVIEASIATDPAYETTTESTQR